jgi:hypothetical protein
VADLQRRDGVFVDCHYLGINNVMALRGDAMKDEQSLLLKMEVIILQLIWLGELIY